jgi:two-component system, LytTR family, sensor kinase
MQESFQTDAAAMAEDLTPGRRPWLKRAAAVFGIWTFFGVLTATQVYVGLRSEGMNHSFGRLLAWQLSNWSIWALFTPVILRLGGRFPVTRAAWPRRVLTHLLFCALLAAVHAALHNYLTVLIRPWDEMTNERPLLDMFWGKLASQFHMSVLIYGTVLGVGYALSYYVKFRDREARASQLEAQLAQAQLHALKMQLHPHFLFNTLNGIAGLVRDNKSQTAVRMIAGLSDLLRHTLDTEGQQEVPLRQELEFLELYLDIQQMRFPDRLRVRMEIAPETLDAQVPNLILQPLVENAIRHGIAPRAAPGTVGVRARRDGGLLEISVHDDGPGLRPQRRAPPTAAASALPTRAPRTTLRPRPPLRRARPRRCRRRRGHHPHPLQTFFAADTELTCGCQ